MDLLKKILNTTTERLSLDLPKKIFSTPRRRLVSGLGAAFLVASVSSLAVGVYVLATGGDDQQVFNDDAAVVDLTDEPIDLHIAPTVPGFPRSQPTPAPAPPLAVSEYRMVIAEVGVYAPVGAYGMTEDLIPLVPRTGSEVAWYDFSSRPGTGSNAIFAGHVAWSDGGVFYDLDQLAAGDEVRLEGKDGTTLFYKVSAVFQVNPKDPDSSKVLLPTDRDVITLITCSGKFRQTDDPLTGGVYSHRLIVRGDLVSIDKPDAAASR
ncbi:MAG TPA: class F sortase [Dehalococcoidia bacterium]|nr:class F sortase [Dehalococcoidia bacterium]